MRNLKNMTAVKVRTPEIYLWEIRGTTVYVKCSPVSRINIITGGFANAGAAFKADTDEDYVTNAKWRLRGDEMFIKAECIDRDGHTTVSPVIYLDNNRNRGRF